MLNFDYPSWMPNLHFIAGILIVTAINYAICTSNIEKKYKYIATFISVLLLLVFPIPFFQEDRTFGSVFSPVDDYRTRLPFTLVAYIIVLLKFYSVQITLIKAKEKKPSLGFVSLFLFLLPHYVLNYDEKGIKPDKSKRFDKKNLFLMLYNLFQFYFACSFIYILFMMVKIPKDLITACFMGYYIPLILGTGFAVIIIFMFAASIFSFSSAYYNYFLGTDFKPYQNKAFLSSSVSEFWQRWNLWGNEWFNTYLYRPLRRKWKLTHTQAMLAIFIFSAFLHSYIVALISFNLAWIAFFVFFINGLVVMAEKPARDKFPILNKIPKPVGFILTFLFLDITFGLFGFSFTKWG